MRFFYSFHRIFREGRDPLSQYRCVFIIGTRLTLPLQLCALPHKLNAHVPSVEKSHTAIVAEATLLCTQYLVSWHNSDFWCHSDSLCPISNTGLKQSRTERDVIVFHFHAQPHDPWASVLQTTFLVDVLSGSNMPTGMQTYGYS